MSFPGAFGSSSSGGGAVDSVNGETGVVVLEKSDIGLSEVDNTSDLDKPLSTSTINALAFKESLSSKGIPNGYASLDGAGHVPAAELPSYVDDVVEYADFASLPAAGETGKIYVTLDDNLTYRWSGSSYVELTDTTAVWGNISGLLSNQLDLNNELVAIDSKAETLNKSANGVDESTHSDPIITINADTTKFDVKAFTYYINGEKYTYPGGTAVDPGFVVSDNFVIVGVNSAGLVFAPKNTFFTSIDLETTLEIGGIATLNGSDILTVGDSYFHSNEFMRNLYLWSKLAKNTDFIGTAGSISEAVTPLRLSIAGGEYIDPDLNKETIPPQAEIQSAVLYYRTAGSWTFSAAPVPLTVDALQYDNGTNLDTLGNNRWASHTIARSSRTGTIYFIYSQGEFQNQAEALDAPASIGGFEGMVGNEIEPLAKVIIQKSATSIDTVVDVRGIASNIVSASTSTLQTTYDRSSNPEIVTSASGGALTLQGGTGVDSDSVYEGKNNAGDTTFAVRGDGYLSSASLMSVPDQSNSSSKFEAYSDSSETITVGLDTSNIYKAALLTSSTATIGLDSVTSTLEIKAGLNGAAGLDPVQSKSEIISDSPLDIKINGFNSTTVSEEGVGIGTGAPQSKLNIDYGPAALVTATDVITIDYTAEAGLSEGAAYAKITLGESKAGLSTVAAGSMDFEVDSTLGLSEMEKTYRFVGEDAERTVTIIDGRMSLGVPVPSAKLDVNGNIKLKTASITTSSTVDLTASTTFADATSGDVILTIPTAVANAGIDLNIIRTDNSVNSLTISASGAELISGQTSFTINQYDSVTLISNGQNWFVK